MKPLYRCIVIRNRGSRAALALSFLAILGIMTLTTATSLAKVDASQIPAVALPIPPLPFVRCGQLNSHCISASTTPSVSTALIFDYDITNNILGQERSGHVGYVWGASAPEPRGGHVEHDRYVAWAQGCLPGRCGPGTPPSFSWLRKNHPNWILWKTNGQGKPTGPAGYKGDPGPIVDFTNPAVQQYWMTHFIGPAIREGFNGIDWDNPFLYDPFSAVGHYNIKHQFIRQYNGALQDSAYAKSQVNALVQFLHRARAINRNVQFSFNSPVDCIYAPMSAWHLPVRYVQTFVDEEGYSYWGNRVTYIPSTAGTYCKNRWLAKTQFYIQVQRQGKHVVLINAQPFTVHPYMTDTNATARAAMQWALTNYFLIRSGHTYFWFGGNQQYGHPIAKQREEQANIGYAFGGMHMVAGVYVRWFSKGMALVNPNPKIAYTISFTKGRYKNMYGQDVDAVTMQPHTGLVLIRRGLLNT